MACRSSSRCSRVSQRTGDGRPRSWSDDNPDALVLLLMPEAEGKGGYFLFYRGKEVDRDFSSFLRESPSLAAKGGGRSDWLNGASPCMRPEEWREAIARFLST